MLIVYEVFLDYSKPIFLCFLILYLSENLILPFSLCKCVCKSTYANFIKNGKKLYLDVRTY